MPVLPRVRGAEKQSASTPALPLATAKSRRRSRLPILTSAARRCRRLLSSTRAPATHPAAAARPRVQPRAKTWALPTTGDLDPLVPERRQAASPLHSTAASILRPDRRSRSRTRSCRSSSECELLSRTSWFLIRYSPINHAPFSSSLLVAMPTILHASIRTLQRRFGCVGITRNRDTQRPPRVSLRGMPQRVLEPSSSG